MGQKIRESEREPRGRRGYIQVEAILQSYICQAPRIQTKDKLHDPMEREDLPGRSRSKVSISFGLIFQSDHVSRKKRGLCPGPHTVKEVPMVI